MSETKEKTLEAYLIVVNDMETTKFSWQTTSYANLMSMLNTRIYELNNWDQLNFIDETKTESECKCNCN